MSIKENLTSDLEVFMTACYDASVARLVYDAENIDLQDFPERFRSYIKDYLTNDAKTASACFIEYLIDSGAVELEK